MRVNDAPVAPAARPDTRIDPPVQADPQTQSIPMPSVSPILDLRNPPPPAPTK